MIKIKLIFIYDIIYNKIINIKYIYFIYYYLIIFIIIKRKLYILINEWIKLILYVYDNNQ